MSGSGSGQFRDYGQSGTLTLSGNSTRTSGTHFRGSRIIKLTTEMRSEIVHLSFS